MHSIYKISLSDKIADTNKEIAEVTFGTGFGGITDMQVGPDGYLYVLSIHEGGTDCYAQISNNTTNTTDPCVKYDSGLQGTIFRIVPQIVNPIKLVFNSLCV